MFSFAFMLNNSLVTTAHGLKADVHVQHVLQVHRLGNITDEKPQVFIRFPQPQATVEGTNYM